MANKGKIKRVETIKGYTINAKQIGCKFWKSCYTCPYPDCIKGKAYKEASMIRSEVIAEAEKRKSEIHREFYDYLNESCNAYREEGADSDR